MKPPKNVRKAMRSFLGVKKRDTSQRVDRDVPVNYRSTLQKSSKKFGSVDHLNRSTLPARFAPTQEHEQFEVQSQSGSLGRRSMSVPPGGRNRIDNWERDYDEEERMFPNSERGSPENGMRRTASTNFQQQQQPTIRRSQSLAGYHSGHRLRASQSMVTLRDSGLDKFSRNEKDSFRDSGAFDMYVNDDFQPLDQSRAATLPSRMNELAASRSNASSRTLPRSASFSNFANSQSEARSLRTTSHASHASERLMSCMSALDHLEKKLRNVTQVNAKVDRFREMTEDFENVRLSSQRNSPDPVSDWRIGGDEINQSEGAFASRDRRRSAESSSTDSGITSNEWGSNNHENPPSRPRRVRPQHTQAPPTHRWHDTLEPRHKRHLRSDSLSSGYSSSSSGGPQTQQPRGPAVPPQHYPQAHPAGYFNDQDSVMSVYSMNGGNQYPMYDYSHQQQYSGGYEQENPYGYGEYAYPPSSVYEEDLHQQNGWFYLPQYPQANQDYYQANPDPYGMAMHGTYPYYHTETMASGQAPPSSADWGGSRYGALNDTFLDASAIGASPLVQAIRSTCAETASVAGSSVSSSSKPDIKKYGSFRYRNGQKTVLVPETRRRKTVRFSKTVNQRVEHCDSEVEDSTPAMKGCTGEDSSCYDVPSAWTSQQPAVSEADQPIAAAVSEPIYEFPTGHIENSCMCTDCKLARSSCKLQTPSQYAYY